jgi:hypothetical protein
MSCGWVNLMGSRDSSGLQYMLETLSLNKLRSLSYVYPHGTHVIDTGAAGT